MPVRAEMFTMYKVYMNVAILLCLHIIFAACLKGVNYMVVAQAQNDLRLQSFRITEYLCYHYLQIVYILFLNLLGGGAHCAVTLYPCKCLQKRLH